MAYDDNFVRGLEWLWGEGFLSPGGSAEVYEILKRTSVGGRKVLDIGCGIGGIDRLLVTDYGAEKVFGIDIIDHLIARAKYEAEAAGLTEWIEYRLVEPGELEFEDESLDIVFSKDSIVHIEDKQKFYEEIFRVLKNGGEFVGSDWLGSEATNQSQRVRDWLDFSKLDFHFCTAEQMMKLLRQAGFASVSTRDRNKWYRSIVRDEISKVSGENRLKFVDLFGEEIAESRLVSSTLKMEVVDAGELCPTIFQAIKIRP
jgi:SAM-dependent methyltransferase